jgi:hypothetical protein
MQINRCPKCGRKPSIFDRAKLTKELKLVDVGVEAECYDCGLRTVRCKTRDEAVAKWNELTNKIKG